LRRGAAALTGTLALTGLLALTGTLALVACGGGDGNGGGSAAPAVDRVAPTVTISDNVATDPASGPVEFGFVFSESPGDSFGLDDVQVGGGVPGTLARVDALRYTLTVTPPAATSGQLVVGVGAGRFADAAGNLNTGAAQATQAFDTRPAAMTLVWSDEFDRDGLPDATKWDYDTERNTLGWFNNELQYYARARPENSRVEGGRLVITARKEELRSAPDWGGQRYTSARLVTRGKASWTYGYIEVRARLPCGQGTWPAIWMLGTGGRWPDDGEIDIVEQRGTDKSRVLGTVHTRAYNYFNGTLGVGQGASTALPDACTTFHDYQLTWTPQSIVVGVDGRPYFEFRNPNNGDTTRWPFDRPQYLILNLAIGGDLGGPVDPAFTEQRMEVEYVRIYRP
jgi:beta-glucanase (GH16 family)